MKDRGLIELKALGPDVALTRVGLDEIEHAIRNPRNHTRNFSATSVQYINHMDNSINISGGNVGAIQTGENASANIQQNIGASIEDISQVFAQMRQDIRVLPQKQQVEAEEIIGELEEQSQKDAPKPSALRSLGTALWGVAGPVLAEGAKEYLKQQLGVTTG